MSRIGLVAGEGKLPVVFSKIARARGDTVIGFGIKGITSDELERHVEKMHWVRWGDLKKAIFLLVTERIKDIVMLGKIKKEILFKEEEKLDDDAKKVVGVVRDKKDYAILNGVTKALAVAGIQVISPAAYLKDLIPVKGVLTRRGPTAAEEKDIEYGKEVALTLSRFDIGQTTVIKEKTVITVEAAEGTDETIKRAGALTGGGFTVVKMARPDQDMRLDVPLVGVETIKAVADAKGSVVALEAGKTLLLDREDAVKLADDKGISIVIV
ncbi:MAG: UDP-2,3-diacylglucosamine diphosphatase LpxI [Candidatus Omnitrophota bacterium]